MFIILFIYLFIFIIKFFLPAPRNQARMEPTPSAVEAQSPNWATGKSLVFIILSHYVLREIVIWQQIINARTQVSDGGIIWHGENSRQKEQISYRRAKKQEKGSLWDGVD